jgi:hypothetical protein
MTAKLTHADYVSMLPKTIECLDQYEGRTIMLRFKCKKCHSSWTSTAIQGRKGCPECNAKQKAKNSLKFTPTEFKKTLPPTIKLLTPYTTLRSYCTFKCKVCKHEWETKAIRGRHGCVECNKKQQTKNSTRTQEDYVELLAERNPTIILIGTYLGALRPALHKHTICGYEWDARPMNLTRPNGDARGCPKCKLKMKEATLGTRNVLVRGYEDKALAYMKKLFKPSQIQVHNEKTVPNFKYKFRGSNRTYLPDMFITHIHTIVEVKSASTIGLIGNMYNTKPAELFYTTRAKARAVITAGFKFKLLVMPEKGTTPISIPKDWIDMNHKQFKDSVRLFQS